MVFACKKSNSSYDVSLYGILYKDNFSEFSRMYIALYNVKNSQIISDANIFLNEQKLNYVHPFYVIDYHYVENQTYNLKLYYGDIFENIDFKTINLPDSFFIIYPESQYISLYQNLIVKWKVSKNYAQNHEYKFVVFFENKSKNPSLVYQTDFLPKETDSISIPYYYIDTKDSRYEIRIFLVNYLILDKFKPYPGYKFSFIAYGAGLLGVFYTRP